MAAKQKHMHGSHKKGQSRTIGCLGAALQIGGTHANVAFPDMIFLLMVRGITLPNQFACTMAQMMRFGPMKSFLGAEFLPNSVLGSGNPKTKFLPQEL
jgi:hypothetical protein